MAPVPLNIAPVFRPWRQAGITHLLLDDEARARLLARPEPAPQQNGGCQDIPHQAAQRQAPPSPMPSPQPPASPRPPFSAPRSVPPRPAQPDSASAPPDSLPTPPVAQAPQERPPRPAPYQPPPEAPRVSPQPVPETTIPPARWPEYWQSLLQKTPPHPTLVWTYPSLSRDLGGAADAAHRDFLRRLLGDMRLPKGSHAFWPLNRYPYTGDASEQSVDAPMFLSGIATLNPESVILMCGEVPPELGLPELRPLLPGIVHGRRFVVTPRVDDIIGDPRRYAQLITFLKAITAGR